MNVVNSILFQCKLNPISPAICVPGSSPATVPFQALEKFIHNVARTSAKVGINRGDVVATYVVDKVLHASLTLGLMYRGVTTISLREPKPAPGIDSAVILSDVPGRIAGDATILNVDRSWLEGEDTTFEPATSLDQNEICRIILTSGSTGMSKAVALSQRIMIDRTISYSTLRGPRFAHCSRFFCDLGLSTSPGIHYLLSLLSRGATIFFLGPDPADILQVMDLYKIEGMATSPYGLGEFLKFFEADSAFQVRFSHVICQGAKLSQELSRRASARMCQNLYSSYGATETSTVAFAPATVLHSVPGAVGYIQPGVVIEAVDNSDKVLPPGNEGLLRVRSYQMAEGYIGDPETTRRFFRGGYFYTGDIGRVTPEGLLVVTGREKTALNVGGDTVSPERVEEVITSFEGVREAGVFARDNELGIGELTALVVSGGSVELNALRDHCARRLPPSCIPVRFIFTESLPRAGQGKLARHSLRGIADSKMNKE
jgi:acyl-CoA synthetase (AMP-forming)/AMP-acid ligase II